MKSRLSDSFYRGYRKLLSLRVPRFLSVTSAVNSIYFNKLKYFNKSPVYPYRLKEIMTLSASMAEKRDEQIRNTFQKESKGLLAFIRKRVPTRSDAEDILQDVFFQFSKNFSVTEPIERVSAWLYQVARNRIIDNYRKKKVDTFGELSDSEETESPFLLRLFDPLNNPEDEMVRSLVWTAIEDALSELPEEQREAFVLHEIEGKDFKEISEIKNIPVNTLLSRKRYAVLHLRKKLKTLYDEMLNR